MVGNSTDKVENTKHSCGSVNVSSIGKKRNSPTIQSCLTQSNNRKKTSKSKHVSTLESVAFTKLGGMFATLRKRSPGFLQDYEKVINLESSNKLKVKPTRLKKQERDTVPVLSQPSSACNNKSSSSIPMTCEQISDKKQIRTSISIRELLN